MFHRRDILCSLNYFKPNMTHPNCDHDCTGNCEHVGCNCLCGEWHDGATAEEIQETLADDLRDTRIDTVKMLLDKHTTGGNTGTRLLASRIVDNLFPDPDINLQAEHNKN